MDLLAIKAEEPVTAFFPQEKSHRMVAHNNLDHQSNHAGIRLAWLPQ